MERRQPDTSRIRGLIGWRAMRSLDAIIDSTIEHMRGAASAGKAT
jgi:nucleoside-diphosphate-sugar epimerase